MQEQDKKIKPEKNYLRRIRSFVRRDGRMTEGQRQAYDKYWPIAGLSLQAGELNIPAIFNRHAPCILEIGFGSGQSLLEIAAAHPEQDFIGIETYKPGIGSLLQGIEIRTLKNIRVYYADAVEVLQQCIPAAALDGVQIFFPDPWQKRKHHKRRLIQPDFVKLVVNKLKSKGILHLATDWEDYAMQMMAVLSQEVELINLAGAGQFALRSSQRPMVTKFEQRGKCLGRPIWELQFARP